MLAVAPLPITSEPKAFQPPAFSVDEKQLDSEILHVLASVKELMSKYRMYSKGKDSQVVSGGLQQYIINKLKRRGENEKSLTQRLKALYLRDESVQFSVGTTDSGHVSMFDRMPVYIRLNIFSFLDARSLCKACRVNKTWNQLLWDNILWSHRLAVDKRLWTQVSHTSNPEVYTDVDSDLSQKEIYLRCSPEVLKNQREENTTFHQVSTVLKYLMPKRAPKAAMFGPGLESSTSGIVRKMLYEDNASFTRVAMFPGQFDGMGAGMTLKLPDGHHFHMSVLYSASKREREQNQRQDRMARNRLMHPQQGAQGSDEVTYELQPALKQLCHTLSAFICVVDASGAKDMVSAGRDELLAMVQERWASPHVPVLVLSCIPTAASARLPAVEVVDALSLSSFTRPWMVLDCVVEDLAHVAEGIQWMIEMCQRK